MPRDIGKPVGELMQLRRLLACNQSEREKNANQQVSRAHSRPRKRESQPHRASIPAVKAQLAANDRPR